MKLSTLSIIHLRLVWALEFNVGPLKRSIQHSGNFKFLGTKLGATGGAAAMEK